MALKRLVQAAMAAVVLTAAMPASAQKVLKVGSTPTGVPFTFLDTKTNSIQGIMVDLITEIGKDWPEVHKRLVGEGGFDRAGAEEHPAVIIGAVLGIGSKPRLRESVGKIEADRGHFRHDLALVAAEGDVVAGNAVAELVRRYLAGLGLYRRIPSHRR